MASLSSPIHNPTVQHLIAAVLATAPLTSDASDNPANTAFLFHQLLLFETEHHFRVVCPTTEKYAPNMTCFSNQRYFTLFNTSLKVLLCLLTLTLASSLSAQRNHESYRGTWQIDTPEDGALILIVKRNGLASYFWGDNSDRTVYQGTWSSDENGATLTWTDGSTHRITRDALGYAITHNDAAAHELYTAEAQIVPKEVLGQWANAPSKPDDQVSDRDKAKGFFGTWKIGTETDGYFVIIESNRSAASNWSPQNTSSKGLRGSWAKQGSELHIAWDTGHYSILKQNERDYSFKLIPAGADLDNDTSERLTATRTNDDNLPTNWYARYQEEIDTNTGGIVFSSRKNANLFYRGAWIIQHSVNRFERIEIGRFGGLKSSSDSSLEGSWRMTGQDIFMRWDNGMREVLSPVGQGFLLYQYKPGRPLDGVPTRILPATPADRAKLAAHIQGRQDVAEQMLQLAEAAGVTSKPAETGWGQTFMRWAWPFGEQNTPQSTEALLQEGFEASNTIDPWWWPFWSEPLASEQPPAAPATTEVKPDLIEVPAPQPTDDIVAVEEATATAETEGTTASETSTAESQAPAIQKATKPNKTKNNWKWPF
jgi:hypothetical protein